MPGTSITITLIEDDDPVRCLLEEELNAHGCSVTAFKHADEALAHIENNMPSVVITDLHLGAGQADGLELCSAVHDADVSTPVILITAFASIDAAIGAVRAGAYDFLVKPFDTRLLWLAVERAAALSVLRHQVKRLRTQVITDGPARLILGASPAAGRLRGIIARIAASDASVMIRGESGSGKTLVARCLHDASDRHEGEFVPVNVATLPAALVESELFGHVRGAFSGATRSRGGLLRQADGGTLFLDEIAELSVETQAKLLQAIETGIVRAVGSDSTVTVDTRVLAATHRDLEAMVKAGDFREDLYFRLCVLEVYVPPLRSRREDILDLAAKFLTEAAARRGVPPRALSPETAQALLRYSWPGNVRELRNTMEHAHALSQRELISPNDLPDRVREFRPVAPAASTETQLVPLEEVERAHILGVLQVCGGNKTEAANVLGIGRKTLYRKLAEYAGHDDR